MIEFQMPMLAFGKYEPDPKTICTLCKESHPAERLITCPDDVRICIDCSDILGVCASEKKDLIRNAAVKDMFELFKSNEQIGELEGFRAIYDAGYRKVE